MSLRGEPWAWSVCLPGRCTWRAEVMRRTKRWPLQRGWQATWQRRWHGSLRPTEQRRQRGGRALQLPSARDTHAAVQERGPGLCEVLGGLAIGKLLQCMVGWWHYPPLLPPAQLLACQPHRLLAGACALAAALPATEPDK